MKDDARVVPNFEEQFQVLDQAINSSTVLSKLKTDKPSVISATAPTFSHATSCINMSKENQGLNNEEVRYGVDSLEAIRIEEFNVSRNTTPKKKKSTRGRPRKYSKGDFLYTENTSPLFSRSSSQATCTPKKTWKRIVDKKENSSEKEIAGPDLGEKRKIADIDRKEDHSLEGQKRKKLEVCSTTLTMEVA